VAGLRNAILEQKLSDLHEKIHRGAYRGASRRVGATYRKPMASSVPLAVAALEDKIVQRATAAVLNQIYEEDFLGFSYGFRPRRGQHDAAGRVDDRDLRLEGEVDDRRRHPGVSTR